MRLTCCGMLQAFSDIYPHLVTATQVPTMVKIADVDWNDIDAAFCCLPHATTQEVIKSLPQHVKVVDLSADFRLQNVDTYREWLTPPPFCQGLPSSSFPLICEPVSAPFTATVCCEQCSAL